jgi:hypothetical protein
MPIAVTIRRRLIVGLAALLLLAAGCEAQRPSAASSPNGAASSPSSKAKPVAAKPAAPRRPAVAKPRSVEDAHSLVPDRAPATLADLAAAAQAAEFALPPLDDGKIAAAGIRKLEGQHIVVYTDLPAADDVDELPQVFDAAVPLWCEYFGVDPAKIDAWKIVGAVMKDQDRFAGAGLYSEMLPDFSHGFNVGSQVWLYDQPSAYYRRHLLLHEGTHAFMLRWLGGAGPPWYMEGMAELLGTHRWQNGRLTLGIVPANREEVPYWGRIKIIKEETKAGRGMSLIDILQYDSQAHIHLNAYAWCWAAAAFLDQHPRTQAAFRELKRDTHDRTIEFSKRFCEQVKDQWPAIVEDWQLFVIDCDYGYDFSRATVVRKAAVELPVAGATVSLAADRGWQSTGYRLAADKTYRVTATGRYQIAASPKPWPCEAGGVTIRYANGQPLGMLLGGLSDLEGEPPAITPLVSPEPIGVAGELEPAASGTLYLKINEPANGLGDNTGVLTVTIRAAK